MGEAESFIEFKDTSDSKLLNAVIPKSIISTSSYENNRSYM